jgi:hypothetical protein
MEQSNAMQIELESTMNRIGMITENAKQAIPGRSPRVRPREEGATLAGVGDGAAFGPARQEKVK